MRRLTRVLEASALGGLLITGAIILLRTSSLSAEPEHRAGPRGDSAASMPSVVINEVAWMGTEASSSDEWMELHNRGSAAVDIQNWSIYGADTGQCLNVSDADGTSTTVVPPQGYLIYANHEDDLLNAEGASLVAIWDPSIGLNNTSPGLVILYDRPDCEGNAVDVVGGESASWFAGDAAGRRSMERRSPALPGTDSANWSTNDPELNRCGYDANGAPINGTPGAPNSCCEPLPALVADLSVAKDAPSSVSPGRRITYHITLSNAGTADAHDTSLTDTLPAAVTLLTATTPHTTFSAGSGLAWQLGPIPPGGSRTITAVGRVSTAAAPLTALVNVVTVTTSATETATDDNVAFCTTTIEAGDQVYFPLLFRSYTPPPYEVIIEALLYDGWQTNDYDEAVLLVNGGYHAVDLNGWELCKRGAQDWTCAALPSREIGPAERLWLARSAVYFARSFGFPLPEEQVLSDWPRFNNAGDEVALRDAAGAWRDVLVYEEGLVDVDGWVGPAVQPYRGAGFAEEGQVLHRRLDEATGRPAQDTDAAADWAQYAEDPRWGRRVRYPGWDLERFFRPALAASGAVTVGIAPDNAYQLAVDTIRSAQESIEIEAYSLEHCGLVTELVERARRGVSVTVLLEGGPVGGVEDQELWACQQLNATGRGACYFMVQAETPEIHPRYRHLHAKLMIVDRERLLLGSQNLVHSSLPGDDKRNGTGGSRGVVLVTDASEVVARAVEVFEADCDPDNHVDVSRWSHDNALGYGPPAPGFIPDPGGDWMTYTVRFPTSTMAEGAQLELLTAPEAALRQSDGLLGLLARAGAGDGIYSEQLYERADWGHPVNGPNLRLQAYLDAARRGARVRLLLNGGTFDTASMSLLENIEAAAYVNEIAQAEGLDISAHLGDPTQYGIHNKMVLVDLGAEGKVVHVGSINGSETSNKLNREMALQVRSAALFDYLYAVFAHDWNHRPPGGHVLISEVMPDPDGVDAGREWVELYNPTVANVDLSHWYVGDVGPGGEYGSGLYRFPSGATLVAEGVIVLAHQAADVAFTPDYEFLVDPHRDDASVPNLVPAGSWDGFGLALGNEGDEVLLLDANRRRVDVVTYGDGHYPGVVPHPGVSESGHSLERRPPREDTDDCSVDFFDRYPPTPGVLPDRTGTSGATMTSRYTPSICSAMFGQAYDSAQQLARWPMRRRVNSSVSRCAIVSASASTSPAGTR